MSVESAQKKTKTFKIAALCILILAVFAIVIVITFSQSKWIANKGIGTQIKLATNRITISHILETII